MTLAEARAMTEASIRQENEPQPPQRLSRVLYSLIIASFVLPFATVSSCMDNEAAGTSYTGVDLLTEDAGALLIGVIVLAALLLAFSFRRRALTSIRQGLLSALESLLCAVAILTTFFATGITFMFSRVSLQIGFYICTGSWFLMHVLYMQSALREYSLARKACREPPPPWGLVVGSLVLIVIIATAWVSEPTGIVELLLGVFAGLLIGSPLVVLAMLFAVRFRLYRHAAVHGNSN